MITLLGTHRPRATRVSYACEHNADFLTMITLLGTHRPRATRVSYRPVNITLISSL